MTSVKRSRCDRDMLRRQVIEKAAEAFLKSGIKNVKMDDIANLLSMSKRTLYELFSDKAQLLAEVLFFHQKEMDEYMTKIISSADNVLEIIFAFYKRKLTELGQTNPAFLRDLRKYPQVINLIKEARRKSDEGAFAYYRKGVEQGIFRSDINFDIINQAMFMQLEMLIYSDLTYSYPLADIYSEITILHMRGITTEKGQKMIDGFLQTMKEI